MTQSGQIAVRRKNEKSPHFGWSKWGLKRLGTEDKWGTIVSCQARWKHVPPPTDSDDTCP